MTTPKERAEVMEAPVKSILTKNQTKTYGPRFYTENGAQYRITATVRYDDRCGNGYNTFSITCDIDEKAENGRWVDAGGGAAHETITEHFPELAPFIKWHLVSSDGPLHYIENTQYHIARGNLDHARSSAVWPEATDEELTVPAEELKAKLEARLPRLMEDFKAAVESFGFTY